ncbi:MAG: N-acetyltransferase, partial [Nevskia sp.]|nr:N-acetyltransferase [Nevskia sp.]
MPEPGSCTIRLAGPADAAALAAVYAPYVRDTVISFEAEPPDAAEMARRLAAVAARLPWLVAEDGSGVLGYAYAGEHRNRAAYRWDVDAAVYLDSRAHRRGIGRALYRVLFALLRAQGYVNAYAGITLPNAASVGLHEALGFVPVGVYRAVGYKFGAWHDV